MGDGCCQSTDGNVCCTGGKRLVSVYAQNNMQIWGLNLLLDSRALYSLVVYRHLLRRDFDLPWMGTNAHFVGGMLGLAYLLACRTFFRYDGGRMGTSLAGLAYSGLLLMVSIVNRGVSSGSGDGMRYGRHIGGLFATYGMKLTHKAMTKSSFGPLGVASLLMGAASLLNILLNIGGKSFKNTDNRKGGNMDVL